MLIAGRGRILGAVAKPVAETSGVATAAAPSPGERTALKRAIACRVATVVALRQAETVSTEVARGRMPAVVVAVVFPGLAMVLRHVRPASVAAPAGPTWGAAGEVVARALAVAVAVVVASVAAVADAAVAVAVAVS